MEIKPVELLQIKWALGRILRAAPGQLPNLLHAWQRAQKGGDVSMPFGIALDDAALSLTGKEKTGIGEVYAWLKANGPRYDVKRDGGSPFRDQPLRSWFYYSPSREINLSAEGVRKIMDWLASSDESSRRSVVSVIEEALGCSERTLWRYVANGLPERMNARVRAGFELLAIAATDLERVGD